MKMRIGVLADSHVPDLLPELPPRVLEIFKGVDIILHAGDICDLRVLHELEPVAQTYAVYGHRDGADVRRYLQDKQRLEFMNRAVGLIHGNGPWEGDFLSRVRDRLSGVTGSDAIQAYVLSQFSDVDVIVFGHSHKPYIKMHGGVLLFNPGRVAQARDGGGTVGILEIGASTIKGRIVEI